MIAKVLSSIGTFLMVVVLSVIVICILQVIGAVIGVPTWITTLVCIWAVINTIGFCLDERSPRRT